MKPCSVVLELLTIMAKLICAFLELFVSNAPKIELRKCGHKYKRPAHDVMKKNGIFVTG
jgi:hypothetical protein